MDAAPSGCDCGVFGCSSAQIKIKEEDTDMPTESPGLHGTGIDALLPAEIAKKAEHIGAQKNPRGRDDAMKRASEEPIEFLEWIGMLLGLVLTVSMTRYATNDLEFGARLALAYANFLLAVPMLAVLIGPFLIRRKRRGLRAFMRENSGRAVNWGRPTE
jgi:hypothetical protein